MHLFEIATGHVHVIMSTLRVSFSLETRICLADYVVFVLAIFAFLTFLTKKKKKNLLFLHSNVAYQEEGFKNLPVDSAPELSSFFMGREFGVALVE